MAQQGLHVEGSQSVLFGNDTLDAGVKAFWLPTKAAFRLGKVTNNLWNFDSVGYLSYAWGEDNLAKGENSSSWGILNKALGGQYLLCGERKMKYSV